ncbi:hypothetical protein CCM_04360 [Cordyceps militaris CM01]|uniref:Uncharacterized protein n=1 Tax=Cordyceps militaris (strain CM01) TaxID=983644 RepID=G3JEH5_CORMM|nr:uncharacterized protein CCM_04360 [Cordyceps militaris CM01]EGX92988.1 hypothetical protein CCM_04360 [Cordyceps militaris CM01]
MAPRSCVAVAAALSLASLTAASWPDPLLSGRDFNFSAVFSGAQVGAAAAANAITLSTQKRPAAGDIVPASALLYLPAAVTLLPPGGDTAAAARYVAFFEISYVPPTNSLDDVLYAFPWIRTNLTVQGSGSGALAATPDTDTHMALSPAVESGEVRNATLQVWRQDADLERYVAAVAAARVPSPLVYALLQVLTNTTDQVSYDFARASIDFQIQNKTGTPRCDVDANGAPIPGVARGATVCTAVATSSTSGKAGGSGARTTAATTAASPSQTSKQNAAAGLVRSGVYGALALAVVGALIL